MSLPDNSKKSLAGGRQSLTPVVMDLAVRSSPLPTSMEMPSPAER